MKNNIEKMNNKMFLLRRNVCHFINEKRNNLSDAEKKIYGKVIKGSSIYMILFLLFSTFGSFLFRADYTVDADAAQEAFAELFNSLYGIIIGVATVLAVVIVAYNILIIMTSKNTRKVEESITWIKAVCIAWLCLMCLSVIITLIKGFASDLGKQGTGNSSGPLFSY
jgi:cytochrome bd-type quinol oxidase subunit 2